MPNFDLPHESQNNSAADPSLLGVLRTLIGAVLIAVGAILGVYVAIVIIGVVDGKEPPGIVNQYLSQAADAMDADARPAAARVIDLSADLKKLILYGVVFLMLLLPVVVANKLVSSGVRILHSDATEALQQIAAKLKQPK